MTPNTHEAGKVSDERLAKLLARVSPPHEGWQAGLPTMDVHAIITELRTRRAESQTGADGAQEALRLLAAEDARNDNIHDLLETIREQIRLEVAPEHRPERLLTNIQNAVYAFRGRTRLMNDAAIVGPLSALEPTPIKETGNDGAECWAGCDDPNCPYIHESAPIKETASPAVPADVQVERFTPALRPNGRTQDAGMAPWSEGSWVRLSDYERLSAENERLRKERDVALDLNKRSRKHMAWAKEFVRAEAALGKLAEASQWEGMFYWPDSKRRLWWISLTIAQHGRINRADICAAFGVSVPQASKDIQRWINFHPETLRYDKTAKCYVLASIGSLDTASLTSPPTEQGET